MSRKIFLDMDGVLADFEGYVKKIVIEKPYLKNIPAKNWYGIYERLPLIPGAVESVLTLHKTYELFIVSSPNWLRPKSCSEKVHWIKNHFLNVFDDHIIFTSRKDLIGTIDDTLIDDHPEWCHAKDFRGRLIHFGSPEYKNWEMVLKELV